MFKATEVEGHVFIECESCVFINVFYLVLFCIQVCVDVIQKKKMKGNKEKYIYLNRYANKFFFLRNFRPLFLTVFPAIVMGLVRN